MTDASIPFHPALSDEDRARAEFYALLGRLYSAAPDAPLLAAIGASELWGDADINPFAGAWNRLVLASRAMDAEAAEQEYTDSLDAVCRRLGVNTDHDRAALRDETLERGCRALGWQVGAMPRDVIGCAPALVDRALDAYARRAHGLGADARKVTG